jgi:hypothetical protein
MIPQLTDSQKNTVVDLAIHVPRESRDQFLREFYRLIADQEVTDALVSRCANVNAPCAPRGAF